MNFKIIKKLTRSNKWQILYNRAKELSNLRLFYNDTDLTNIQVWFLYWLEVYSSLYLDLATNEDYINEEVIEDDLRTEAYLLYRQEKRKEKTKDNDKEIDTVETNKIPRVIFSKRK